LTVFDLGGGFPIEYEKRVPPIKNFARVIIPLLKKIKDKNYF